MKTHTAPVQRHRGRPLGKALSLLLLPLALAAAGAATAPAHATTDLVLALGSEPDSGFDPIRGWGSHGAALTHSALLSRDRDLALVGDLATDWTVSEDRLRWTVDLRGDLVFADGSPLTAADVAFTFNTARDAADRVDLTYLDRAEAVGDDRVVFHLRTPRVTFAATLATLGIVSEAAYDGGVAPLASGPLMLIDRTPGAQAIFAANPHYHGDPIAFDTVTLLFAEPAAALAALRSGSVHLAAMPALLAENAPPGVTRHAVDSVDNRGILFPMAAADGRVTEAGDPIGNAVTADRAIRLAVNQAVDRASLAAGVLAGFGRPAFGPADGLPWDNPAAHAVADGDPDAARQTLAAAGWADGDGDGIVERDGVPARFTLLYPASDPTRQALALAAADMVRPAGIDMAVEGVSWDVIAQRKSADAVLFGWGSHDPQELYNLFSSTTAGSGWYNPGFYGNPSVDAHLTAAQSAPTLAESLPHWQAAAWDGETGFGVQGDTAWAWLVNLDHIYLADPCLDIGDRQIEPHGHGMPVAWNLTDWAWTCP